VGPGRLVVCPAKVGSQPVPSVAWSRVTLPAKRTQGVPRPCNSAPKGDCSEADTVFCVEGSMERVVTARREPLGGVVEQGMVTLGSFRNLGGL
jgi:hypothetical protein